MIGLSTHNDRQVEAADRLQPDYIGFGPIFAPGSKTDHDPIVGIDALRRIRALTRLPIFAIGGFTEQVRAVIEAGADGIAVISALASAPDIQRSQPPSSSRCLTSLASVVIADMLAKRVADRRNPRVRPGT